MTDNRDQNGPDVGTYPLEVGHLGVLWPILLSGAAHKGENLVNLLNVALALKQGGVQDELSHDAAHAPHVYSCRVLLHTCKQTWSACCASARALDKNAEHGPAGTARLDTAGTAQQANSDLITWQKLLPSATRVDSEIAWTSEKLQRAPTPSISPSAPSVAGNSPTHPTV